MACVSNGVNLQKGSGIPLNQCSQSLGRWWANKNPTESPVTTLDWYNLTSICPILYTGLVFTGPPAKHLYLLLRFLVGQADVSGAPLPLAIILVVILDSFHFILLRHICPSLRYCLSFLYHGGLDCPYI